MNIKELREKSVDELKKELLELCKERLSLRLQKKTTGESQPKPHQHKRVRRAIAQIKTVTKEKETGV